MTEEQYELLKSTGMMWEIYPQFTGDYEEDMNTLSLQMGAYPKGQKYATGTRVWVVSDLGRSMDHFRSGVTAVVEYTYAQEYGGDNVKSYGLKFDDERTSAWYYEHQLIPLFSITDKELEELRENDKEVKRYLEWHKARDPWYIISRKHAKACLEETIAELFKKERRNEAKMEL